MDQFLTVQVVQGDGYLVHTALCHCLRKTDLKAIRVQFKIIWLLLFFLVRTTHGVKLGNAESVDLSSVILGH